MTLFLIALSWLGKNGIAAENSFSIFLHLKNVGLKWESIKIDLPFEEPWTWFCRAHLKKYLFLNWILHWIQLYAIFITHNLFPIIWFLLLTCFNIQSQMKTNIFYIKCVLSVYIPFVMSYKVTCTAVNKVFKVNHVSRVQRPGKGDFRNKWSFVTQNYHSTNLQLKYQKFITNINDCYALKIIKVTKMTLHIFQQLEQAFIKLKTKKHIQT